MGTNTQHGVQSKVWADRLLGPDLGSTVLFMCLTPSVPQLPLL